MMKKNEMEEKKQTPNSNKSSEISKKDLITEAPINSLDLNWFLTVLTTNFGQDYRQGKLKEKCLMLFEHLKRKGFTQKGFKKAVERFIQSQRWRDWTIGDFFAHFPNDDAFKGFIAVELAAKTPTHRIVPMEEALKKENVPVPPKPLTDEEQAEMDLILENMRLRCRTADLERQVKALKRTSDFTKAEVKGIEQAKMITRAEIIEGVRKYFNLEPGVIESNSRKDEIKNSRHVAIYLMRFAGYTLEQCGEAVNTHYSSAINSVSVVRDFIETDPLFRKNIREIAVQILGQIAKEVKL